MTTNEACYADYVNYIKRNEPTRTPMTFADFVDFYELPAEQPVKLVGVADQMHY